MGYVDALPILQIKNSTLCLVIPFLKYKVTGQVDKTLVYPIKYTVTVSLHDGRIINFEDLSVNPAFENVDFDAPIGTFRHDSVKHLDKHTFREEKDKLYKMYDRMIDAILNGSDYGNEEDEEFMDEINMMLEPSLKPIYKILDSDFYNKYLSEE